MFFSVSYAVLCSNVRFLISFCHLQHFPRCNIGWFHQYLFELLSKAWLSCKHSIVHFPIFFFILFIVWMWVWAQRESKHCCKGLRSFTEKNVESTYSTQTPSMQTRSSALTSHYGNKYSPICSKTQNWPYIFKKCNKMFWEKLIS